MDLEGVIHDNPIKRDSWKTVLTLAYQSLGVVYGDLSTSPLYVYKSTFAEDIQHSETNEEIYGVLSFVFWTLTLIPLVKYVFIVLRADDNGEGGTFALYSLLCRNARVSSIPNCQLADEELSDYTKDGSCSNDKSVKESRLKSTLEKFRVLQRVLLVLALIGTCMVIGDGVLTPAISVYSAVSGLELSMSRELHQYIQLPVTCAILVFLFALQHYGTHKVGFLFAPIVITWLMCISAIGVYNIIQWNPHVYQALSPYYMYKFLKKTQTKGWMSLGGMLLCITGSEAMFADLGHFSQLSIKIAFTFVVYPSLILAYMGQAAYLSKHHIIESDYRIGFYVSVPVAIRWPVLGIAILAAVVGSQAIITGTFSIIKQCSSLGCFPKVKIVHTSSKMHGQIYIPEINWVLMLLCLAVTVGFRNTKHMGNAAGLAVITVMLVTTCLMSLVIVLCWHKNVLLAICFVFFFGSIEAVYFSASLIKFLEGAWVPVALSFIFLIVMYVWHYGTLKKYEFDVQNKVSINWLLALGPSLGLARVRGIGVLHTQLVSGIPAIFSHFVTNLPAFHQVLVFLCIKSVPVPYVRPDERFLVGRVGPKECRMYRCIARYGYRDVHKDDTEFEKDLICSIAEFIRSGKPECHTEMEETGDSERMTVVGTISSNLEGIKMSEEDAYFSLSDIVGSSELTEIQSQERLRKRVRFLVPDSPCIDMETRQELQELVEAREAGMAFILGHSYVRAKRGSSCMKRIVINYGYDFLRRNSRGPTYALSIPRASTLELSYLRVSCIVFTKKMKGKVVGGDKYRSYIHGEAEKNTKWRFGGPPNYDIVNKLFEEGRTKVWPPGSLEEKVQNLVKTWEMEIFHKTCFDDYKSIADPKKYTSSLNGRRPISLEEKHMIGGGYNAFMQTSLPEKLRGYNPAEETVDTAHVAFTTAFPRGFALEVLQVYSGPPVIAYKFRHWAFMEGPFKGHPPTGEMVELFGIGIFQVNEEMKVMKVEFFMDRGELLGGLMRDSSLDGTKATIGASSGCPVLRGT